jgi:hypothetical protein
VHADGTAAEQATVAGLVKCLRLFVEVLEPDGRRFWSGGRLWAAEKSERG